MRFSEMRSRYDIGYVLNEMGLTGVSAEIGVAFGENAELILDRSRIRMLLLVDPWDYVPGENPEGFGDAIKDWGGCYNYCVRKLSRFAGRTTIIRSSSCDAAEWIKDGSLDFVYIDANHMSPYVDADIEAWYPKVRSGGVFGGHDYHNVKQASYTCDVKSAVDSFLVRKGIDPESLIVVPDECPSWYLVKA